VSFRSSGGIWGRMSNPIHKFLTWFPIALATSIVGICATWEKPKVWVANQADWLLAKMSDTINIAILVGICAAACGGWLWAFLKTAPKEPEYLALAELLAHQRLAERPAPASAPHVALNVHSASHAHTASELNAVEADDTPKATGSVALHGLYVGWMIASAGTLQSKGYLEIAIRAFNGTGGPVRIRGVKGHIKGEGDNFHNQPQLPVPAMITEHSPDPIPNATEFLIILNQHLGPEVAKEFLNAFETGVQIDLRDLNIEIESSEDPTRIARLPVWDGLALKRRDDVFTGRIMMMSGQVSSRPVASLSMVVTRADGSTEKRSA